MKKLLVISLFVLGCISANAQAVYSTATRTPYYGGTSYGYRTGGRTVVVVRREQTVQPNETIYVEEPQQTEYTLDRKVRESSYWNNHAAICGLVTRVGYAFNYDAITYGASIIYTYNGSFGITAGFDGYYIPNKMIARPLVGDTVSSRSFSMPLWDIRFGFVFKKIVLGAMLGKVNIGDDGNVLNLRQDAWFVGNNSDKKFLYGGFITFLLPVSDYFGFNIDFAVTNKTGFNVGGGINITLPYKDRKK